VYDLIIVPGGGVQPDGSVAPWVENRLDRALGLRNGAPILCLSAGTMHKPPPVDAYGYPVFEALAGARYLLDRGLDPHAIYLEFASYDTIGNAFFARTTHTDLRDWRKLLIVNSAFHMERTEAVFRWVFGLSPQLGYELTFETVPDRGMPQDDLAVRRAREQASLERVKRLANEIRSMSELHRFLFTEHQAYTAERVLSPPELSESLKRVY
jgi:uncharacterized SAM-binding protein YcdF (DUF218 family)